MDQTTVSPIPALSSRLQPYDVGYTLGCIGALQLVPRNADQAIRIEALAHAAACVTAIAGKPNISAGRLRLICDSPELSSYSWAEDPCDEMFVEEMSFFGGSYRVMPGITEAATFILQHLSKAIFLGSRVFAPREFVREARLLLGTALIISEEVSRRAGLAIGTLPIAAYREPIVVPDSATLQRLLAAVTFTEQDLRELLSRARIPVDVINTYVLNSGSIRPEQFSPDSAPLLSRPLVRANDNLIAVCPSSLLAAARHALILHAQRRGVLDQLSERYNAAVWDTLKTSLSHVQHEPVPFAPPPGLSYAGWREGLFRFDTDKLMYTILVTDPLTDYSPDAVFGNWSDPQLHEALQGRILEVETQIYGSLPWVNEVLFLVSMQGVGRAGVLGFSELPRYSELLAGSAAHIETMTLAEGGEPLALWKYAQARRILRDRARVVVTSEVDEFQMYRSHKHSFYFSDDVMPNLIFIPPGEGGPLRRDVAEKRAWHTVPAYDRGYFRRVTSLHDTSQIPIYVAYPPESRRAVLLEGLPAYVWIIAPRNLPENHAYLSKLYALILDGIAYWLWQFTPFLRHRLEPLAGEVVRLDVELVPDAKWNAAGTDEQYTTDELAQAVKVSTDPELRTICVKVTSAMTELLGTADNRGERELMIPIVRAFNDIVPEERRALLTEGELEIAADIYAPLGLKKMLLFLKSENTPQLDRRDIPRYRPGQEADVNVVLDRLGAHLRSTRPVGPILPEETNEVIKHSVAFFMAELETLVASLSPKGLLEYLIRQHEAVSRETAYSRLTLPTRIACYGSVSDIRNKLQEEIPVLSNAALAGRFLIEFVTAVPARGYRQISLSCFDEMRALASHIVNDGMLSDLVHFELAKMKLSILPSGRLGIDADEYRSAMDSYLGAFAAEEVIRSPQSFSLSWRDRSENKRTNYLNALDAATSAEFGTSISELLGFLTAVMNIGYQIGPGVSVLRFEDLIAELRSQTGFPESNVKQYIELFSLGPRTRFYDVTPPHRTEDVYPWRFNRELSYLRRPLIRRRQMDIDEVLWGNRHVEDSKKYLFQLCTSGHLRPRTPEMRRFSGDTHDRQGDAFNHAVAEFFRSLPGMGVWPKFKKLKTPHGTLRAPGDIDVLAADPKRASIYPVECKSLSAARTPFELATEMEQLLDGTGTQRSMVQKHILRVEWCQEHLHELLGVLNLDRSLRWKIVPYIVVDQPMVTVHMRRSPIPILTFSEIKERMQQLSEQRLRS